MARVPYLETSDLSAENQDLLKRRISLFQALVNSPDAARAFGGLGTSSAMAASSIRGCASWRSCRSAGWRARPMSGPTMSSSATISA